jgi:hypothetical protein
MSGSNSPGVSWSHRGQLVVWLPGCCVSKQNCNGEWNSRLLFRHESGRLRSPEFARIAQSFRYVEVYRVDSPRCEFRIVTIHLRTNHRGIRDRYHSELCMYSRIFRKTLAAVSAFSSKSISQLLMNRVASSTKASIKYMIRSRSKRTFFSGLQSHGTHFRTRAL